MNTNLLLASFVLALHVAFICWLMFGVIWTRCRPMLRWLHLVTLVWGVIVEVGSWPCPLTYAENWLTVRAGGHGYTGGFIQHYLGKIVYPDISPRLLATAALVVIASNVTVYVHRFRRRHTYGCW